ncbi:MAG: hypothetical protein LBV02_00840 [Bacteroidales bacterium]|jgi:DNA gyrase/topoisomerase IV subunit A|nr:hypothetical protein [Bacteroidales bacterium]
MEEITLKNNQEEKNPLKKWVIILGILMLLFMGTTIYFAFFGTTSSNVEYKKSHDARELLQLELNELLTEHENIKSEYGELTERLTEKDSIIMANADEIKKLINSQADYNKIKKQLARLQNIAKEYVEEMDKLYEENKALKEENTQVKESLQQERVKVATIQRDKDDLSEKISTASVLKVYGISSYAVAVKSRKSEEVITDKASKSKKLKITFTVGENSLLEPGPINLYARIAIPGTGKVLSPSTNDLYTFNYNGEKMQYTSKTTINYTNKAESVTLYWDIREGDKAIKGKYLVEIFSENMLLGETFFVLE